MRLFDATAAQSKKTNLWGYNQMVIDRINEVVGEDDYLIVFGDITFGSLEDSKEFLSQIKAKWEVVDLNDQRWYRLDDFWKEMGAAKTCSIDGFVVGTIGGQKANVIISTNSTNTELWLGEKNYIAMAESAAIKYNLLKEGEIYKDQILNLSLSAWDFYPIDYEDVPRLIDDEILFKEMEEQI